jgi:hypothetical protein
LVSANNRELGRCARAFENLAACQTTVIQLRERIENVRALLAMADVTGTWTWRVELDGRDVATAGRSYQRQRECHYNLGLFLAAVPVALISEGLVSRPRLRGLRPPGPAGSGPKEASGEGSAPPKPGSRAGIQAVAGTP